MKKILISLGLMFSFLGYVHAVPGDIEHWKIPGTTVPAVVITSSGQLFMTDGIVPFHELFNTPLVSSISVLMARVTTDTLRNQGTFYTLTSVAPAVVQPVYPIGLIAQMWTTAGNATGNGLRTATETATATLYVYGTNAKGGVAISSIAVSTSPSLTTTAFAKISSISVTGFANIASSETLNSVTPALYITIGSTGTFGLPVDFDNANDIYKVKAFGVDTSSYTLNTDRDTITLSNPNNGIGTLIEIWGRMIYSAPRRNH